MTLKEAKALLRPLGITLRSDMESGEYRVNFSGGKEATAYYTPDLDDALNSGRAMAEQARQGRAVIYRESADR
jgi:hypothetical protein